MTSEEQAIEVAEREFDWSPGPDWPDVIKRVSFTKDKLVEFLIPILCTREAETRKEIHETCRNSGCQLID